MSALRNLSKSQSSAIIGIAGAFTLSLLLTQNLVISSAVTIVVVMICGISLRRVLSKRSWIFFTVLPEIIDHLISGIQSGLSLNESLINLSQRGPKATEKIFKEFHELLLAGETFEIALSNAQNRFALRSADQLFESLLFAKHLGGGELLSMLRQLGDFVRQDLALRREIEAKQGWIRNSAHMAAGAPWLLLLLLSAQPATSNAFSTSQGVSLLGFGVIATGVAYLWMGKLGELPEPKRIFGVPS